LLDFFNALESRELSLSGVDEIVLLGFIKFASDPIKVFLYVIDDAPSGVKE
jgi:hypothetical protein